MGKRKSSQSRIYDYAIHCLLMLSLFLNLYMMNQMGSSSPQTEDGSQHVEALDTTPSEGPSLQEASEAAPVVSVAMHRAGSVDWKLIHLPVVHSLAQTFGKAEASIGGALTATFARIIVWDLNPLKEIQKNDQITVLWRPGTSGRSEEGYEEGEVVIGAGWLRSGKKGRTLKAYRFKAAGDTYPSYWDEKGEEIAVRLNASPIDDYEVITSLFRVDRPNHVGWDFKASIGTEVMSPKDGTVERVNWREVNGNCIEVRYGDGVLARFLHLEEVKVKRGERVRAGQVIGLSGNTGKSSGPHLHYELKKNDKYVDPGKYHTFSHRRLDAQDRLDFQEQVEQYDTFIQNLLAESSQGGL